MEVAAAVLMLIGALSCLLATIGLVRFPDLYTRMHAASKAGPLGAGLILLAGALSSGDWAVAARGVLGLVFLLGTAPVSAHLLARAALRSGSPPPSTMSIDRIKESS